MIIRYKVPQSVWKGLGFRVIATSLINDYLWSRSSHSHWMRLEVKASNSQCCEGEEEEEEGV